MIVVAVAVVVVKMMKVMLLRLLKLWDHDTAGGFFLWGSVISSLKFREVKCRF